MKFKKRYILFNNETKNEHKPIKCCKLALLPKVRLYYLF